MKMSLEEMQPTKMAVIDVGRLCNVKCTCCYYRYQTFDAPKGKAQTWMKSKDELGHEVIAAKERGCDSIDFTGGEPTIHPDIISIIDFCRKLGIKPRIITNGQHTEQRYKDLITAGCNNFLLSLHNIGEELNKIMQKKDAFDCIERTMKVIEDNGAKYAFNAVIMKSNYKDLPKIAKYAITKNPYLYNFINCNPPYEATPDQNKHIQAPVSKAGPMVKKAIDTLMAKNIWVNVRYFPMCNLKGYEMHICNHPQVMFDWKNEWDYGVMPKTTNRYLKYARDNLQMISNKQDGLCADCGIRNVCGGINKGYEQAHGQDEIIPYEEMSSYPYEFRNDWESVDIVIPVYKMNSNVTLLLNEIAQKTIGPYNVIIINRQQSAAKNRNAGLEACRSRFVIQCDDDIRDLQFGWNKKLISKLMYNPDVVAISARLVNPDGTLGINSGDNYDISKETVEVKMIPTACCIFRNSDVRFDNRFIGSGYEDTNFFRDLQHKFGGKILIDNTCKVTHINEEKNSPPWFKYNEEIFLENEETRKNEKNEEKKNE